MFNVDIVVVVCGMCFVYLEVLCGILLLGGFIVCFLCVVGWIDVMCYIFIGDEFDVDEVLCMCLFIEVVEFGEELVWVFEYVEWIVWVVLLVVCVVL